MKKVLFLLLLFSTAILAFKPVDFDLDYFDGNNIFAYMENDGTLITDDYDGNSGLYWPSRASLQTACYLMGFWAAGQVDGEARTACAEYKSEWVPGKILADGSADNPHDEKYKLYKIQKRDRSDPDSSSDWVSWPVDQGAPWVDVDGDGVYNYRVDTPELMGDQMIWYVMNDLNRNAHDNVFGSAPLGLEARVKIWGYNRPEEYGDMMFVTIQIFNKGGHTIDSCYVGVFTDTDLGDSSDDFVGCDTTLELGYTYNNGADGVYGSECPAVGVDILQGPMIATPGDTAEAFNKRFAGFSNLGMTTFSKFFAGGGDIWGDPNNTAECFHCMKGLTRNGAYYENNGVIQYPLKYAPGDPVAGTGWLDSQDHASGDRRHLQSSGPFTLAPGDSQEVVITLIIGAGSDHLASITRLKQASAKAQVAWDLYQDSWPVVSDVEVDAVPEEFTLFSNYPNPFNPVTTFRFNLKCASAQHVRLEICDIRGRRLATILNEMRPAGSHTVQWDSREMNPPSGVYLARLMTGNHVLTRKICLLK